mgnify:CR=1 FL=1
MKKSRKKNSSLGSLDLLVLRVLNCGDKHGYGIARNIELLSSEVLSVKKGSLYPALHRLENEGFIKSKWELGDAKQSMKIYSLTSAGQKQMEEEIHNWELTSGAINRVIAKTSQ